MAACLWIFSKAVKETTGHPRLTRKEGEDLYTILTESATFENHLRPRARMAQQDVQTQVGKYISTIYHDQSPQPMDIGAAATSENCQGCGSQTHKTSECWYRDETCTACGKRGQAKVCRSGHFTTVTNTQPQHREERNRQRFHWQSKG